MEFSHIGKHCQMQGCKQLDFLPFSCNSCQKEFCLDHRTYEQHKCAVGWKDKDKRVNSCPLCEQPVSISPGENINVAIDKHITNGCKSESQERLSKNRCKRRGCKKSELIPFVCKDCKQQFCVSHRNQLDHKCVGRKEPTRTVGPFRIPIRVR